MHIIFFGEIESYIQTGYVPIVIGLGNTTVRRDLAGLYRTNRLVGYVSDVCRLLIVV